MEFRENKLDLEFQSEVNLNTMPLRVDMILIKKKQDLELKNEIGKIFRQYNLIEYKSPNDTLNYDDFLKGIAYAYLFKSYEKHVDDISLYDVTLTFIREIPPLKLLKKLKEMDFIVEEAAPGIYYINRDSDISIQIIVTKHLDQTQHIWINSLTNQIDEQHARKLVDITKNLTELDDKNYADSVWEVVATENIELLNRLREDKDMCNALAKIMKPEIDEAFNTGFDNGFNNGQQTQLFNLLKKGRLTFEEALAETSLTAEEFQTKYKEYLA